MNEASVIFTTPILEQLMSVIVGYASEKACSPFPPRTIAARYICTLDQNMQTFLPPSNTQCIPSLVSLLWGLEVTQIDFYCLYIRFRRILRRIHRSRFHPLPSVHLQVTLYITSCSLIITAFRSGIFTSL